MGESVWWVMTSMLMTDFQTFQSHVILMFLEDIEYVNQGRSVSTQLCSGGNCNLTASTAGVANLGSTVRRRTVDFPTGCFFLFLISFLSFSDFKIFFKKNFLRKKR